MRRALPVCQVYMYTMVESCFGTFFFLRGRGDLFVSADVNEPFFLRRAEPFNVQIYNSSNNNATPKSTSPPPIYNKQLQPPAPISLPLPALACMHL